MIEATVPAAPTTSKISQYNQNLRNLILGLLNLISKSILLQVIIYITVILVGGGLFFRSSILGLLDSIDAELYAIENTTLTGKVKVTEDVKLGATLPFSEIASSINSIPDTLTFSTTLPIDSQLNVSGPLAISSSIPINTNINTTIDLGGLMGDIPVVIPINSTLPVNSSLNIGSTLPVAINLPSTFQIPIDKSFLSNLAQDQTLEISLPVYAEIPVEFEIQDTNLIERFDVWHGIINKVRAIFGAPSKTSADFNADPSELEVYKGELEF